MLLSAASKFLSGLLVLVLTGAAFTFVLNRTVLDSDYLKDKLAATGSYARLSVALNEELTKRAQTEAESQDGQSDAVAMAAKLGTILTPEVLEAKLNSALDQMHAYYRGDGPAPVLDLTDLVAQARQQGIPIPEDADLTKPVPLSTSDQAKGFSAMFNNVRLGTAVTALALIATLLLVSWKRHKWTAVPNVLIVAGVLLGLAALTFSAVSGMAADYIKFDTEGNALASIGRDLASLVASDLAKQLGIIAAVLGVVGIATRILVARLHPRLAPAAVAIAKPPKKPAAPTFVK